MSTQEISQELPITKIVKVEDYFKVGTRVITKKNLFFTRNINNSTQDLDGTPILVPIGRESLMIPCNSVGEIENIFIDEISQEPNIKIKFLTDLKNFDLPFYIVTPVQVDKFDEYFYFAESEVKEKLIDVQVAAIETQNFISCFQLNANETWHSNEPFSSRHVDNLLNDIVSGKVTGEKAHRWLGWAQCAVVAAGIGDLEDMKHMNKNATVD